MIIDPEASDLAIEEGQKMKKREKLKMVRAMGFA